MKHPRPLEGVVVVELGHSVAAPYAGLILADLGARVIKVENPEHGDYARGWGPPFWGDMASAYAALNRGKESITVDFSDPGSGRGAAPADHRSGRRRDPESAARHSRRFRPLRESFRKAKPSLIWCDIGAFGAKGPMSQKPGYDPLVQASTGIMSVTGEGDRPPVRVGISLVDLGSGMWTALGFLSAFISRMQHGDGAQVSTSLYRDRACLDDASARGLRGRGRYQKTLWLGRCRDRALPGVPDQGRLADDRGRQRQSVPQILRRARPQGPRHRSRLTSPTRSASSTAKN